MDFGFNINDIIPYEITIYDSNLNIINKLDDEDDRPPVLTWDLKKKLALVIDKIGTASALAQGLKEIITTYQKLRINDNHRVYLIKDENNGKGTLVGLLKVGKKRLFVHDLNGNQHELHPLCVLDFFIHTSQQRKGLGKRLFDYMLRYENVHVKHLAIDTPSEKSVRFLNKHYNLTNPIPQVNKFVIFGGFFDNRDDMLRGNRRNKLDTISASSTHSNKSLPPLSDTNLRRQTNRHIGSSETTNDKLYQTQSASIASNKNVYSNESLNTNIQPPKFLNPHLAIKQYSAPNLEKLSFPTHITTTQNTFTRTTPSPSPSKPPNKILSPIENQSQNNAHTSPRPLNALIQQTDYERKMANLNYNKYDPFPSLSAAKPPIYGQYNNNNNRNQQQQNNINQPINRNQTQNAYNNTQINKYAPFPSLNPNPVSNYYSSNNNNTAPTNQPQNAYFLDKYRKTKLW